LINENKLHSMDYVSHYRLINAEDVIGDYRNNPIVVINNDDVYDGLMVLLELSNEKAIGPFKITMNGDRQPIVNVRSETDKYLISEFSIESTESFLFNDNRDSQTYVKIKLENREWIDTISDDELLTVFKKHLDSDTANYDKYVIGKDIPPEIKKTRLKKLQLIMTDKQKMDTTFKNISKLAAGLILKYPDEFNKIIKMLANEPDFMRQIQKVKIIDNKIEEKNAELQNLENELSHVRQQTEIEHDKTAEKYSKDYEKIINDINEAQNKLNELNEQLSTANKVKSIEDHLKNLEEDIKHNEWLKNKLDREVSEVESRLDNIVKNKTEKLVELSFDGMLSSRMLKAAAAYENDEQIRNYAEIIRHMKSVPETLDKDTLIDYLCTQVQKYRPSYNKNMILNIFTCIVQNFLTVFSGKPGIGKTSICNIAAHVLGLNKLQNPNDKVNSNRFISVSVERGWTSKRDFIGYYNPLTKQFDRSNRQLFDAFNIMNGEIKDGIINLPYIILLDEANLSPMEYYWADFMNVCDDINSNISINLGEDYQFKIPDFLRFMATINNDHTTESLSPRLIDRAFVIKLPTVESDKLKNTKLDFDDVKIISWQSLNETFNCNINEEIKISGVAGDVYDKVLKSLKDDLHIHISPRTELVIKRYWSVAESIFEYDTQNNIDASISALDYAIAQKILPNINASGQQFGEMLNELKNICDRNNLILSSDILNEIINKGNNNMFYYQYFD
ncbi:MAG: hypothetical protein IJ563_13175, partial [Selenomonadaceae bacterium]|nr:hypothetical protein [Selenomonadaceae bacterium]